ncbi:gamma-glutamyl-gamma-aminobutyrate hydrolase family protein [Rhodococcus qingshengii]|uniref:Gamma-glutamyl-gamma-aminobutyrate hydrolase family protein n=1 Tax=Rhodococcus qingshengii TaxID=334542 RepID=A0AAW6LS79_RHOSG|nr:gamma-glutamyl-gamma-aminobutyrate hydrolase family protein [Rhodococcus qingshengii]MDE8649909.1 gamma-glutamyl-gamma-aminobutyrate hydrolase family protein [Rhodococcus qingshengii]
MSIYQPPEDGSISIPHHAERPVIGISMPKEQAKWRIWSRDAHLLSSAYGDQVWDADAIPVFVPVGGDDDAAKAVVTRLDALVLTGGGDVDSTLYGADPHPKAGPFDSDRDAWELSLARHGLDRGVPILGICRGMQLLNVFLGGTLIQHLPDSVGSALHNPTPGVFATHAVSILETSRLGNGIGTCVSVPTYHHQAVATVAPSLHPVAWASDGTIEALEDVGGRILAVQWHPEVAETNDVISHFVKHYVVSNTFAFAASASGVVGSDTQGRSATAREE